MPGRPQDILYAKVKLKQDNKPIYIKFTFKENSISVTFSVQWTIVSIFIK